MERVWIYQASRILSSKEEEQVKAKLEEFTSQWKAHGTPLAAYVEIRYGVFVFLVVDQSVAMPSGCSIDKSVRLLKELEVELGISLFDRMQIAYKQGDTVRVVPRVEFEQLLAADVITENTVVFNNLIDQVSDLANKWEVPFKESWHARVFA